MELAQKLGVYAVYNTLLLHLCFVTLPILLRSRVFQSHVFQPLLGGLIFFSPAFYSPSFSASPAHGQNLATLWLEFSKIKIEFVTVLYQGR